MQPDTLRQYIIFNKAKIVDPADLTPEEARELLLAYIEYQES